MTSSPLQTEFMGGGSDVAAKDVRACILPGLNQRAEKPQVALKWSRFNIISRQSVICSLKNHLLKETEKETTSRALLRDQVLTLHRWGAVTTVWGAVTTVRGSPLSQPA